VSALDQVLSAGETGVDEDLVRRVLGIADREAFFELAGAIVAHDPKAALHALHRAFEKGLDARELAEGLAEHVRHLLILRVDPEAADLVAASADELKRLRAQCEGWSEADLMRLLRLASEASWPMRDSPQPLIHLEAAVLQMATLEPAETLAEILARLEALEQRLTGAPAAPGPAAARAGTGGGAPGRHAAPPPRAEGPLPRAEGPPARADAPTRPPARSAGGSGTPGSGGRPPAAHGYAAPGWSAPGGSAPLEADAAAATATLDEPVEFDDGLEQRWKAALTGINARKRMLGAFLEESRFLGLARDGVLLAMDELHMAVVGEQENRALIVEEVGRAFGRPLALHCVLPVACAPVRRPGPEDVKPMIERAMEWFEGEVIERPTRPAERANG
jgi:DNA polymerase-3 subunit gamma/tau